MKFILPVGSNLQVRLFQMKLIESNPQFKKYFIIILKYGRFRKCLNLLNAVMFIKVFTLILNYMFWVVVIMDQNSRVFYPIVSNLKMVSGRRFLQCSKDVRTSKFLSIITKYMPLEVSMVRRTQNLSSFMMMRRTSGKNSKLKYKEV